MKAVRKRIDSDTPVVHPVKADTTDVYRDPGVDPYLGPGAAMAAAGEVNPAAADTAPGGATRPSPTLSSSTLSSTPVSSTPVSSAMLRDGGAERNVREGGGPEDGKAACPPGQWEPSSRHCPYCGSGRVHRSRRRGFVDASIGLMGATLRRCHDCRARQAWFGAVPVPLASAGGGTPFWAQFGRLQLGAAVGFAVASGFLFWWLQR